MKILFVHQNYPGQYKHLLPYCAAQGHRVLALGNRPVKVFPASFPYRAYKYDRSSGKDTDPLAQDIESKFIRARSCANAAIRLRDEGFYPDVICVHTGWGEDLFLQDVWPQARLIGYCEYYYNATGFDLGFDSEYSASELVSIQKLRAKNASNLLSLQQIDVGVTPTQFQWSSYPSIYRPSIRVIHDGIDTQKVQPAENLFLKIRDRELSSADSIVTYVSRSLEPARGFHRFMRALPRFQELCPDAHVVIIGSPEGGYGAKPEIPYKQQLLEELKDQLNLDRIYFPGRVPYPDFLRVLGISSCHVYFTIPFVLSWSLLESMAAGCLVIGSNTAPLHEVIQHEVNGLLVDYFDADSLAAQMAAVIQHPLDYTSMREAARHTVIARFERQNCLVRHHALIEAVHHGIA